MIRLYVMPLVLQSTPIGDARLPKYVSTFTSQWASMDYGTRLVCLISSDTTTAVHNSLVANSDVYAFPDSFQTNGATVSGAARTALQNKLESFGIPATWIANGDTYLFVAHTVGAMFQFIQRHTAMTSAAGVADPYASATLNTQIGNLPLPQLFYDAAHSLEWVTTGINNTSTIRNALKYLADQWGSAPLNLNFIVF